MRVLVTGSRDWPTEQRHVIYRALNAICDEFSLNFDPDEYGNTLPDPRKITVVHGACPRGADLYADDWCLGALLHPERHPANWQQYGKRAGFLRNREMVELGVDLCLAFIKDNSKGASMTVTLCENAGIPVRIWRA